MSSGPIFCDPSPETAEALREHLGGEGLIFNDLSHLRDHLQLAPDEDTIVLGPGVSDGEAFSVADYLRGRPDLGVILMRRQVTTPLLQEALRAGMFEVVDERDLLGLESAIKRSSHLAASLRENAALPGATAPAPPAGAPSGPLGRVITVFAAKGGCGKTTLATNLAAALADRGRHEVCLVDLDLTFGDVAIAMQLFPARTIADAVPIAESLDARGVSGMLTHHSPGLNALVAPTDPSLAESIEPALITRLLGLLRQEYEFIVIDTPPTFDDPVLAALDVSDLIALIVTPDVPALKNLKITLETLIELNYSRDRFRLVLNRADAKVGITHSEVESTAGMTLAAQIPSSRDVPATINRGVPIVQDDPKHPVSVAIRTFGEREVLAQGTGRGDRPDRRGFRRRRPKS